MSDLSLDTFKNASVEEWCQMSLPVIIFVTVFCQVSKTYRDMLRKWLLSDSLFRFWPRLRRIGIIATVLAAFTAAAMALRRASWMESGIAVIVYCSVFVGYALVLDGTRRFRPWVEDVVKLLAYGALVVITLLGVLPDCSFPVSAFTGTGHDKEQNFFPTGSFIVFGLWMLVHLEFTLSCTPQDKGFTWRVRWWDPLLVAFFGAATLLVSWLVGTFVFPVFEELSFGNVLGSVTTFVEVGFGQWLLFFVGVSFGEEVFTRTVCMALCVRVARRVAGYKVDSNVVHTRVLPFKAVDNDDIGDNQLREVVEESAVDVAGAEPSTKATSFGQKLARASRVPVPDVVGMGVLSAAFGAGHIFYPGRPFPNILFACVAACGGMCYGLAYYKAAAFNGSAIVVAASIHAAMIVLLKDVAVWRQ